MTDPKPEPRRLSFSAADTWDGCPKKWHAKYVDHIDDPSGPEALAGTLTHTLLEHIIALPAEKRDAKAIGRLAHEHWPEDTPDSARSKAIMLTFAALRLPELSAGTVATTAVAERRIETELGGVPFVAVIDRTDTLPSGAAAILDYKTGKRNGAFLDSKRTQVMLYAASVEAADRRPVAEASIVWIPLAITDRWPVARSDLTEAVDWLGNIAGEIAHAEETGVYKPKPGHLCSWCPVVATCPEGMDAVRRRARNPSKSLGDHGIAALAAEAR